MPLDQLLAALEREAREEADQVLAEARADAERIDATVSRELANERDASLGMLERDLEAELEAELSTARLAARREVLLARERLLERLFTMLGQRIATQPDDPRYRTGLASRVTAALACFEPGAALELRAAPTMATQISTDGVVPDTVAVVPDTSIGTGFRVTTSDGTIEVVDTLESRIDAQRVLLARRALAVLEIGP